MRNTTDDNAKSKMILTYMESELSLDYASKKYLYIFQRLFARCSTFYSGDRRCAIDWRINRPFLSLRDRISIAANHSLVRRKFIRRLMGVSGRHAGELRNGGVIIGIKCIVHYAHPRIISIETRVCGAFVREAIPRRECGIKRETEGGRAVQMFRAFGKRFRYIEP